MHVTNQHSASSTWLIISGVAGLAWNAFGVFQFFAQLGDTPTMGEGLSAAQADIVAHQPWWMLCAFAVGVFGGLIGSALLVLRRKAAVSVFTASLIGYVILYVGDITTGIFTALGMGHVVVLSIVVAIAVALLAISQSAAKRGRLV